MKIREIIAQDVGPLMNEPIILENNWSGELETKVLFTGPNGCGKSTLLRGMALLWDAVGYWLDHRKSLPMKHEAKIWLQQWTGFALILDRILPFYATPVGVLFGTLEWANELRERYSSVVWIGEAVARTGKPGQPKRELILPQEKWLEEWSEQRKKMILSHDKVDCPNVIYLDAEERRWVQPKRNISEPQPDVLSQRWLTKYLVSEDWKGQLEASLITLKTTQLHRYHKIIRNLNSFLIGKEIDPDIKPGEGRLRVRLKNKRGGYHSLDDLSAGEHQVLILIYLISRWQQPGGIVLIDEPDLYLHPSLVDSFLSTLEHLISEQDGQLLMTSHSVDVWNRYDNFGMRQELKLQGEE
ncbi:putative ABC-type transporter [Desulfamplus magnetovallimortis]|uniref:Putative ABC-type transporter n=1 Tax=Desulfamplus magnetovallimortis TaxID=1246637 RepID=A0A1W1HKT7_9BACT|nr:ATP-binding protein [Desulfamplus magnetovallimortis]SLM33035.1 putative ABC-type transporter [Desulfamplus magnetovallimortis]